MVTTGRGLRPSFMTQRKAPPLKYRIHKFENPLFALRVAGAVAVVGLLAWFVSASIGDFQTQNLIYLSTFGMYLLIILAFLFFQKVYLVAYMKGNGVRVSARQFPEAYERYAAMCRELGLRKPPKLFILQEGGMLNAFAIRFSGSDYVAVYSDVFELVEKDPDTLGFILAHELGHVTRRHMSKRFWTAPSFLIPFLASAYSRSCEYTCDNIGHALSGGASSKAMLLLAAGKKLYGRIDPAAYVEEARGDATLSVRFMSLFMSHPYLPKRIRNIESLKTTA